MSPKPDSRTYSLTSGFFIRTLSYQGEHLGRAFPESYLGPHKEVSTAIDCPINLLLPVSPRILLTLRPLRRLILTSPLFGKQLSLHSLLVLILLMIFHEKGSLLVSRLTLLIQPLLKLNVGKGNFK